MEMISHWFCTRWLLVLCLCFVAAGCGTREDDVTPPQATSPTEGTAPAEEPAPPPAEETTPEPAPRPESPKPDADAPPEITLEAGPKPAPEPQSSPPPTPEPKPQRTRPKELPYTLPKWQVGQSVTYRMKGEGPDSLDCDWEIAIVGAEKERGKDWLWLEMRVGSAEQQSVLKMLTTEPKQNEFREDPARVFFGVSQHHRPARTIIQSPGSDQPIELDLSKASAAAGAPRATVPPMSRWQFDEESARLDLPAGQLVCHRFYVAEGAPDMEGAFEAWHSPAVPITGLARMRGRQADGQRFEMELKRMATTGAKSVITRPPKKMSALMGERSQQELPKSPNP